MRRLNSTVVVVAGERAGELIPALDTLHNVRGIASGERSPAEVAEQASRAAATYVLHDADPLAAVGDAWVGFFDGAAPAGGLEVAIETTLGALRSERLPRRGGTGGWGCWPGAAPSRVVPAAPSAGQVADVLGHLSAGRWWPEDLEGWLRSLPKVVPDRAGLPAS